MSPRPISDAARRCFLDILGMEMESSVDPVAAVVAARRAGGLTNDQASALADRLRALLDASEPEPGRLDARLRGDLSRMVAALRG